MERVVSKNLFNFQMQGHYDEDIQQAEAAMVKMGDPLKRLAEIAKLPTSCKIYQELGRNAVCKPFKTPQAFDRFLLL